MAEANQDGGAKRPSVEPSDDLQQALAEAVEAVEAEERVDEAVEGMLEVGDDDDDEEEVLADEDEDEDEEEGEGVLAEGAGGLDDEAEEVGGAASAAVLKAKQELEAVLEKTQSDAKALREKWMRAAADLENFRKRAGRERDEIVKFANERLLKEFLEVLDDLDRTIEAIANSESASVDSLLDGVRMVSRKFLSSLEKHGVTTFQAAGTAFDPGQHEAVQQVHDDEVPAGAVASELRRGYFLNGRLLRPAMVAVSLGAQGGVASPASDQDDEGAEAKADAPDGEGDGSEAPKNDEDASDTSSEDSDENADEEGKE